MDNGWSYRGHPKLMLGTNLKLRYAESFPSSNVTLDESIATVVLKNKLFIWTKKISDFCL